MAPVRMVDLGRVLDGARAEFARGGLRRTLMSDIARAAGVSTGTLYNVAVSKDALFLAVFLAPEDVAAQALPMPVPPPAEMMERIGERLRAAMSLPAQAAASSRARAQDPVEELRGLVAERYDALAASWQLLAAVEQTAKDIPEVSAAYYTLGRTGHVDDLAGYLQKRVAAGQVRPVDPRTAARFVVEAVTWWAWHRHEDQQPPDITDDAARALVQDMVTAALLA